MKLNKFVKFPLVLGLVGTICAGALGLVYEITNPIIQDRINAEANAAIKDLLPEITFAASDVTETYEDTILSEKKLSQVKKIIVDDSDYAYSYQVTGDGRNGPIDMLVIISATEEKILNLKVISHSETKGYGDVVFAKEEFSKYFQGLSFDAVSPKVDFCSGASMSFQGVISGVERAIAFHKEQVLKQESDGINLTNSEKATLALPEDQKMVDKTEEFLAKLGSKADKFAKDMGLLNYVEIVDASEKVIGYAYITETEYIIFEGLKQKHRAVFMFDANWENSKLVVVSSSDTLGSAPDYKDAEKYPTLVGHPFLNQFNGRKMEDLVAEYMSNSDIHADLVAGGSVTTRFAKNNILAIVKAHREANK